MAESDSGDRTEAPTGRRLDRAREEGNIAQSKEIHLLSGLACATLCIVMTLPSSAGRFVRDMQAFMEHSGDISGAEHILSPVFHMLLTSFTTMALPIIGATIVGSLFTSLLQSGFLIRGQALIPDLTRLNPLKGIKRFFSVTTLIDTIKALAKPICFSIPLYGIIRDIVMHAPDATSWSSLILTQNLYSYGTKAIWSVLAVQCIIAILDEAWTRYHRLQNLRMSRHDIREETKDTDGNPHIKGRMKQLRLRASRRRLKESVKKATVIVTNPTHYAVALAYEEGSGKAPIVVAKGVDELAARIRKLAGEEKIPIVPNPPLARALYTVPEDTEIPYEYFQAVAAIIAWVWKVTRPPAHTPPPLR
ncbi:MAG: flagellar type III secretion system protein FlhB [Acetobacter sp.]|jgi:flagellar biosynthetic protein FlhB